MGMWWNNSISSLSSLLWKPTHLYLRGGGGEPKLEALFFQSKVDIQCQNAHKTQKTAKARTLCACTPPRVLLNGSSTNVNDLENDPTTVNCYLDYLFIIYLFRFTDTSSWKPLLHGGTCMWMHDFFGHSLDGSHISIVPYNLRYCTWDLFISACWTLSFLVMTRHSCRKFKK